MENPKRQKLGPMSKESTMVIGEYRIDLKAKCPKKISISDY